jgi:hypothetical protein
MTASEPSTERPAEPWGSAFDWIEKNVGGRIVSYERQPRWRPAFYVEFEKDGGEIIPLYVRGARTEIETSDVTLHYEMRVLQQLEADGIPVPHVYGYVPEPAAIVMERSPGRGNLGTAESEEERVAVLNQYIDILARTHSLDIAPYQELGMDLPSGEKELGLCDLPRWEANYRKAKSRPEPIIEFCLGWLKRNIPEGRSQVTFLSADSGQFVYENSQLTALVDLELACLGDPAADLGGMLGRDLSEPLGDLPRAFKRYFELRGETIPTSVIDFHTVRFNLYTPMAIAPVIAHATPDVDLVQYLGWYWVWSRACLEVLAHGMGLELDTIDLPEAKPSRFTPGHDNLTKRLKRAASGDDFAAYEMDAAYRCAEYLRRAERFGGEFEQNDLDEISALLGRSFETWSDADAALEDFIESASPESDADLIRLLHRRTLRHEALLQPVLRELEGASIQHMDN